MKKNIELNNPKDIYSFLEQEVDNALRNIGEVSGDFDVDMQKKSEKAQKELEDMRKKLKKSIREYEENSEWKHFSIAFFGETGAGKSTIIETLRLLFKEKTKIVQQNEYKNIYEQIASVDDYESKKAFLHNLKKDLEDISDKNRLLSINDKFEQEKRKFILRAKERIKTIDYSDNEYIEHLNDEIRQYIIINFILESNTLPKSIFQKLRDKIEIKKNQNKIKNLVEKKENIELLERRNLFSTIDMSKNFQKQIDSKDRYQSLSTKVEDVENQDEIELCNIEKENMMVSNGIEREDHLHQSIKSLFLSKSNNLTIENINNNLNELIFNLFSSNSLYINRNLFFLKFLNLFKKSVYIDNAISLRENISALRNERENYKNIEIQKALTPFKTEIEKLFITKDNEINYIQQRKLSLTQDIKELENWFTKQENLKEKIEEYYDGRIIGDGRSDFTKKSISYNFNINNHSVNMIDIPGIEGNEKSVENEINSGVRKTHAVFYVTKKGGIPNEGTLKKINQYLSSHSEVRIIFNKSVTAPRALEKEKNNDSKTALGELEQKFRESFGNNYKGEIDLLGLPAFLSQAENLASQDKGKKEKFIEKVGSADNLCEVSGLSLFEGILKNEIIGDLDEKIRRSNLYKLKVLLDSYNDQFKSLKNIYASYEEDTRNSVSKAKKSIDINFKQLPENLDRLSKSEIEKLKYDIRNQMYEEIDKDISNDEFKDKFEQVLEKYINKFEQSFTTIVSEQLDVLSKEVKRSYERLQNDLSHLNKGYSAINIKKFNLNIDIDINKNIYGILGSFAMAGAAMWWNPVGWVAITATVASILLSAITSLIGFFDSDYKKRKQKKELNKHLPEITEKVKKETDESISLLVKELDHQKENIYVSIDEISNRIGFFNIYLRNVIEKVENISKNISESFDK